MSSARVRPLVDILLYTVFNFRWSQEFPSVSKCHELLTLVNFRFGNILEISDEFLLLLVFTFGLSLDKQLADVQITLESFKLWDTHRSSAMSTNLPHSCSGWHLS